MNDFEGLLSSDYGFKPSGKSAPMANVKSMPKTTSSSSSTFGDDRDTLFRPNRKSDFADLGNFDDVFANSKSTGGGRSNRSTGAVDFDSIFGGGGGGGEAAAAPPPPSKFSSMPVFDKPVYDDDDVSSSPVNRFDDIFGSKKSSGGSGGGDVFDDLLGGLGKKETSSTKSSAKGGDVGGSSFDDLLPGFGGSSSMDRSPSNATKKSSSVLDDPFVVLESGRKKFENTGGGGDFNDINPLADFPPSVPPFSAQTNRHEKDESPLRSGSRVSGIQTSIGAERGQKSSVTSPERGFERRVPMDDFGEPTHSVPEMPSVSTDSSRSVPKASSPVYNNNSRESYSHGHFSPPPEEKIESSGEIWLTVSEIPLFTQPTAAPPPSRPPPPRHGQFSKAESGSFPTSNAHSKVNEYSNHYFQTPKSAPAEATGSFASPLDEFEEFAAGGNHTNVEVNPDVHSAEDFDPNSAAAASAAAMKEAMDRAEAKFRYARGVRERENAKVSRSRENVSVEKEEKPAEDSQDREFREGQERLMRDRQQREVEEQERRQREEEERRRIEKEREERERERERERRRVERERELARQAVERATREARERAAIEARMRAERAAVQKANAEARERAERTAVQRAQAEARERAAASAKERAEKAAAEAREKERAQQEKEARERAAQQKNEPDFDSIFGVGSRANSAPRPRTSSDPFETQFQSKPAPEATRSSVNSTSSIRKASSSTSIVDDLSSIFGAPPSSMEFQNVEGETEERRKARLEREQRIKKRAEMAVAEKNARDLEAQREQAERGRISETLDVEIKRWAAGKEGNLRALLSTLQYVLWPECGWQPVSLTDLITGASVKKVYRKATLCIHPDKVQQKGANLQQKYVAEKVFDLLKEAWNKFNSEELF